VKHLAAQIGDSRVELADFTHLPTRCKFVAFMPQWDFLNFLAAKGKKYKKKFDLRMRAEATGLIHSGNRVVGVRAKMPRKDLEIRADLVVGTDGRHSTVREAAGLVGDDYGAPMDVLWFRISKKKGDKSETFGHAEAGVLFIMLDRGDYWQCAYVIPKGGIERVKARGIEALRASVLKLSPFLKKRVAEIKDWDDVKLLTVAVDRLRQWHQPGLICIGDAAHAMSPIGGVGINMAVQDAVAAANILAGPLKSRSVTAQDLHAVEQRRLLPVKFTQWLQITIQKRLVGRLLRAEQTPKPPLIFRLAGAFPILRRIPARLIGIGIRPEHIHTGEV
jgi:2-polyprenyl-6-methoxyphenol hydroxylase-like FAD-dependent oxidoreductase